MEDTVEAVAVVLVLLKGTQAMLKVGKMVLEEKAELVELEQVVT